MLKSHKIPYHYIERANQHGGYRRAGRVREPVFFIKKTGNQDERVKVEEWNEGEIHEGGYQLKGLAPVDTRFKMRRWRGNTFIEQQWQQKNNGPYRTMKQCDKKRGPENFV